MKAAQENLQAFLNHQIAFLIEPSRFLNLYLPYVIKPISKLRNKQTFTYYKASVREECKQS